ncbi:hypothetical protein JTB14_037337 [Gonioctena quinquepunctata]|nr:hypothetical protein JTB14_037337 [Gonioctena quinquepunctata]
MADFQQFNEGMKRASLLSLPRTSNHRKDVAPPKDKFFLMHLLFFFIGFGGAVPMSFFLTATDYWMFKFRDVSQDDYDAENKTFLQKNFASISSILSSVPSALTTVLASMFAHKIKLRIRLLGTITAITSVFVVFTVFVKIDTDSWQTEFFIITMIVNSLNGVFATCFQVSALTLFAKFPNEFIKIQGYGMSVSGVVGAILQILCLWIGGTRTQVALIYYSCATSILVVTVILTYLSEYHPLYQFYMTGAEEHMNKPVPTLSDIKEVFKRIWLLMVPLLVGSPIMALGSPTITILIVSEYYKGCGDWSVKYYIPVATFLLKDLATILGRYLGRPFVTPKNVKWFMFLNMIQIVGMSPLFVFCNALPRKPSSSTFST